MPEEKSQQSEALTKEDLRFAKERIKSLLAGHKKVWAAQGVSPVISALVSLTDKLALARDNNGETKPGGLYTFLTSSVLSGASAELVNYYVMHEQVAVEMELQKRVHQEFDNFPIAERKRRKPEEITVDDGTMRIAANGYLGSKGNLIGQSISAGVLLGTTLISGGLANLPIMGAVIGASGVYSYLINKKMNADKIAQKNQIRKAQARLSEHSRHMYSNSLEREINDPQGKSYQTLEERQSDFLGSFKSFAKMLSKYALVGTLVKGAIVGGVAAATWATNPANVLITATAALGCYSAVTGCVNSFFSLKEHVGNFAHAYKNFRSKMQNVALTVYYPHRAGTEYSGFFRQAAHHHPMRSQKIIYGIGIHGRKMIIDFIGIFYFRNVFGGGKNPLAGKYSGDLLQRKRVLLDCKGRIDGFDAILTTKIGACG